MLRFYCWKCIYTISSALPPLPSSQAEPSDHSLDSPYHPTPTVTVTLSYLQLTSPIQNGSSPHIKGYKVKSQRTLWGHPQWKTKSDHLLSLVAAPLRLSVLSMQPSGCLCDILMDMSSEPSLEQSSAFWLEQGDQQCSNWSHQSLHQDRNSEGNGAVGLDGSDFGRHWHNGIGGGIGELAMKSKGGNDGQWQKLSKNEKEQYKIERGTGGEILLERCISIVCQDKCILCSTSQYHSKNTQHNIFSFWVYRWNWGHETGQKDML